jgi:hypothetical protein
MDLKLYITPPFMVWERRQYLSADRVLSIHKALREELFPKGWHELDYTHLSAPWTMDATPERDSLHIIGHSMQMVLQLFVDQVCRD